MPTKTVKTLLTTIGNKATGPVRMTVHPARITFTTKDYTIRSKVIDGTFPDYTRVVPKNNEHVFAVDPGEMQKAATRLAGATTKTQAIKVTPAFGTVEARFECEDHSITVDCIGAGHLGAQEFGIAANYIQEIMKAFADRGAGTVDIAFGGGNPVLFTAVGIEGLRVCMPKRV